MSLLHQRPAGVRVQATMDGLRITLPPRRRLAAPRQPLHRAPLAARLTPSALIFGFTLLLTAPTPLVLAYMGRLDMEPVALAACALVAAVAAALPNVFALGVEIGSVDRSPAAEVRLAPHQLILAVDGQPPQAIGLDDIERVTVDRAGARMRIGGRSVPLLPQRPGAERDWLGAVLDGVLRQRAAGSADADAAREAIRRMVQQRSL